MAVNANTPFGLKPVRGTGSQPYNDGTQMFFVPASDATALNIGDPVVLAGSADAAGVATVTLAAAAGPITGVVVGFMPDGTTNMVGNRAASTAAYVLVETNPLTLFEIQDTAGTIGVNDIGLNANLTIAAGNAYTKRSGVVLNAASKATTATLAVRIRGLSQKPDNSFGAFAKVLVQINNSTEGAGTASAGL